MAGGESRHSPVGAPSRPRPVVLRRTRTVTDMSQQISPENVPVTDGTRPKRRGRGVPPRSPQHDGFPRQAVPDQSPVIPVVPLTHQPVDRDLSLCLVTLHERLYLWVIGMLQKNMSFDFLFNQLVTEHASVHRIVLFLRVE